MITVDLTQYECPLMEKEEVKKAIAEIMGDAEYEACVGACGYRPSLCLEYTDFIPEIELQRRLQERIPNLYIEDLVRNLSDEVEKEVIHQLKVNCIEVWVYNEKKEPCQVSLMDLVYGYMADKEVRNGKIADEEEE